MSNIAIITDSASDIKQNNNKNITVLPLTVSFDDNHYKDGVDLTPDDFYMKLIESSTLPKTSQISPYDFEQAYDNLLKSVDKIIVVTLSSKLSGTYQSACIAASEYEDKVYVVDSENVTVGEQILVDYAVSLINKNICVEDIVKQLNTMKKRIRLVALLDTLEYLKKGGRISSGAAFLGNVLSIKPVIAIADGEVSFLGKARGSKPVSYTHLDVYKRQLSWNWLYIAIHVIIGKQVNLIRLVFQLNILHRIESDILL